MELEEAIEKIEKQIYKDKDKKEYWHYIDICYDEMYEFTKAIERVLEELDRLHFYRDERETIKSNLEIDLNRKGVLAQAKGQIHEILQIYKTNDKYLEDKEIENE